MSRSSHAAPFSLDHLRRQAIALGTAAGVPSTLAAVLAQHVLWYEMLGASAFGLRALPGWLVGGEVDRLDRASTGQIVEERTGTARLDASGTLSPLAMSQAVTIAAEKARENGVAVVQVAHLSQPCPAGDAAAREALGPLAIAVLTSRPAWVAALPSVGDLPYLADSDLDAKPAAAKSRVRKAPSWTSALGPMLAGFAPEPGGALVVALHIPSVAGLDHFRERLALTADRAGVWLTPTRLSAARQEAEQRGLEVAEEVRRDLDQLAARWGIPGLDD